METPSVMRRPDIVCALLVVAACGGERVEAKAGALPPIPVAPVPEARAPDAGPTASVVVTPEPVEAAPLVRVSLARFATVTKACAGLLARSASPVLRNEGGFTFTSVRTDCRTRAANPDAGGPSLVAFSRTAAVARHANVDTVAAALAFPVGSGEWMVAIEAVEESEGMQSMPLGDVSGSVEVAHVERVDLVAGDAPELVFVLDVAEHPNARTDLVVCDAVGAWCTKPATLERRERRADASRVRAPRSFTFRRHPRGVLVLTTGEPPLPGRVYPFAIAP